MPKATRLLEKADPATLNIVRQAFDEAWQSIQQRYTSPSAVEAARYRLATFVLALARNGEKDIAKLRDGAIAAVARDEQPLKFKRPD